MGMRWGRGSVMCGDGAGMEIVWTCGRAGWIGWWCLDVCPDVLAEQRERGRGEGLEGQGRAGRGGDGWEGGMLGGRWGE